MCFRRIQMEVDTDIPASLMCPIQLTESLQYEGTEGGRGRMLQPYSRVAYATPRTIQSPLKLHIELHEKSVNL